MAGSQGDKQISSTYVLLIKNLPRLTYILTGDLNAELFTPEGQMLLNVAYVNRLTVHISDDHHKFVYMLSAAGDTTKLVASCIQHHIT